MIEMCGVDRVLFGTDFGPVPMSPKLHIDLVDDMITDAGDRDKIFSTNTLALLRLTESAPRLTPPGCLVFMRELLGIASRTYVAMLSMAPAAGKVWQRYAAARSQVAMTARACSGRSINGLRRPR
jgi:hypothetical protein